MKLGCSTYSFWHFKGKKEPLVKYLEKIYIYNFDGAEILEDHFENTTNSYILKIKRYAFSLGLDIFAISIHNDFVNPSERARKNEVEKVKKWLEIAYKLGAKAIRINSGRWRTIESFDELMKQKGVEPPIPGYTDEDALRWVTESIQEILPVAEEYGVVLALENHWGITRNAENIIRIIKYLNSDWLRVLMDIGNFTENIYQQLEEIAPYTVMVHAKTYIGGGEWYTLSLDYDKIFSMIRRYGFQGWVSLEYEGKRDYDIGVKISKELLSKYVY